jgi:hypothetical protein
MIIYFKFLVQSRYWQRYFKKKVSLVLIILNETAALFMTDNV